MARRTFADILGMPPNVDRSGLAAASEEDIRRHAVEDGHDPDDEVDGYRLVLPPRTVRERLGLTQAVFAAALRVPIGTVRNWEQGRTLPDPAARSLLDAIAAEPVMVLKALRETAPAEPKAGHSNEVADPFAGMVLSDVPAGPFGWTAPQRDRGRPPPFEAAAMQAGERLRHDLALGGLVSQPDPNGGALYGDGGSHDPATDVGSVLAARRRVRRALDAVGPEMSGLLIDLCGFLKRLERIEAERGWPPRSAQIVSGIALGRPPTTTAWSARGSIRIIRTRTFGVSELERSYTA